MAAAANGHTARLNYLIRLGADIDHSDDNGWTALHHAAFSGWEDTTETLLQIGANSEAQTERSDTPLHLAAFKGRVNVVNLLIRNRAIVNSSSQRLGTPLHCACAAPDFACAKALIEAGADSGAVGPVFVPSSQVSLVLGWSGLRQLEGPLIVECQPLLIAVLSRSAELVSLLATSAELANATARIGFETRPEIGWYGGDAAALTLAAFSGLADGCRLLIERGAAINAVSRKGDTALMLAARQGNHAVCNELLDLGVDVNAAPSMGRTALHAAAMNGRLDTCLCLLSRGAIVDAADVQHLTALHLAARYGRADCVKALLQHGASTEPLREHDVSPMMLAVNQGHVDVVRALAEHKSSTSMFRHSHARRGNILHSAIRNPSELNGNSKQRLEVLRILLSNGVDVLAKNSRGEIPVEELSRRAIEHDAPIPIESSTAFKILQEATLQAQRAGAEKRYFPPRSPPRNVIIQNV